MSARRKQMQYGVVLAADVGSYSNTTLSLAVQMAASIKSRLRGVFIEDEDLMQVAGLPCTREISLTTALERPTSVAQMQRALRSVAEQFSQSLQQQAQARQIDWSFDYTRGRLREIGLNPGADVAYVIVGRPVGRRIEVSGQPRTRRILLLATRSPHQEHALSVALDSFGPVTIELTRVNEASPQGKPAEIKVLRNQAENRIRLVDLERARLFELLSKKGYLFDCAILPRNEEADEVLRIMERLVCPVILTA